MAQRVVRAYNARRAVRLRRKLRASAAFGKTMSAAEHQIDAQTKSNQLTLAQPGGAVEESHGRTWVLRRGAAQLGGHNDAEQAQQSFACEEVAYRVLGARALKECDRELTPAELVRSTARESF